MFEIQNGDIVEISRSIQFGSSSPNSTIFNWHVKVSELDGKKIFEYNYPNAPVRHIFQDDGSLILYDSGNQTNRIIWRIDYDSYFNYKGIISEEIPNLHKYYVEFEVKDTHLEYKYQKIYTGDIGGRNNAKFMKQKGKGNYHGYILGGLEPAGGLNPPLIGNHGAGIFPNYTGYIVKMDFAPLLPFEVGKKFSKKYPISIEVEEIWPEIPNEEKKINRKGSGEANILI